MWGYTFFCDGCHSPCIIEYLVFILQSVVLYRPKQRAPWQMVCRRCLVLSGCLVYLLLRIQRWSYRLSNKASICFGSLHFTRV